MYQLIVKVKNNPASEISTYGVQCDDLTICKRKIKELEYYYSSTHSAILEIKIYKLVEIELEIN